MNREEEFGQAALVAGSLIGLRSFRVVGSELTGCVRPLAWQPGVNVAVCAIDPVEQAMARAMRGYFPWSSPESPHRVAGLDCTCGFYAYFDTDANPHHLPGNVLGLIEGTGRATVGSRGFRVEKARLVALIKPTALPYLSSGRPIISCDCAACTFRNSRNVSSLPDLSVIARAYGDVPIFSTLDAALAEFPLTPMAPVTKPEPPPVHGGFFPSQPIWWLPNVPWVQWAGATRDGGTVTPADEHARETPKERALRLRRERNTGPGDRYGLGDIRRAR